MGGLNVGQFFIGLSIGLTAILVPQLEEEHGEDMKKYSPFLGKWNGLCILTWANVENLA